MFVVESHNVSFRHTGSRKDTLLDINLAIGPGEIVGLAGRSGIGKSTLADILLGILKPTRGQVAWCGKDRSTLPRGESRKLRLFYQKIFQDPAASFPPHQTAGKALRDLVACHRLYTNDLELYRLLDTLLTPLGLDQGLLDRYPHQLSGGEMQRLALARIMLLQPYFVVADEPTSRLDLSAQAEVVRLLEQLARTQNWSFLFISHDEDLLHAVCDRRIRLVRDDDGAATLVPAFGVNEYHQSDSGGFSHTRYGIPGARCAARE